MKLFDRILIYTAETLLGACWVGLFIVLFNFENSALFWRWIGMCGITFFLGLWKSYRNAEERYFPSNFNFKKP